MGYLFMLFVMFLLSLGLGKAVEVYSISVQRERETQLIEVGAAYRRAIKDYYLSAPDGRHRYPARLDDLLKDDRHVVTRRYLRKLYLDPMTSRPFMPLMAPQGGIWGVSSASTKPPLRVNLPAEVSVRNVHARSYAEWFFMYDGVP